MKHLLFFLTLLPGIVLAQKVGIGTNTPIEKLDVNGNVNVSGTIKANGIAGQPGQVLTTNNAGNIQWNSINSASQNGYADYVTFYGILSTNETWTVPAGVTKINVEAWGGGGGGSLSGGGGGGGYVSAPFTVVPGSVINITVGAGGTGTQLNSTEQGQPGANTILTVPSNGTTWYVVANGGAGAYNNAFSSFVSSYNGGGSFYVGNMYPIASGVLLYPSFIGEVGESGYPNKYTYTQVSSTVFLQEATGGSGGDAGNTVKTGGGGARNFSDNNTINSKYPAYIGAFGGGGGGGGMPGVSNGQWGGRGKVIIWY